MGKILCIGVLFLVIEALVFAQDGSGEKQSLTIKIDRIISNEYPDIRAYAVITNKAGEIAGNLSPGLFAFKIDSMDVQVKSSITPFQLQKEPIDYSILFSDNGIMEGEPLDFQKNAVLQFIETMQDTDTLSLYTIGDEAVKIFEEQDKASIDISMISSLEVSTKQPRLYDSVMNVLRKAERRKTRRKVAIIISDGRDQNSRFSKEHLREVFSEVNIPIYAIGMRVLNAESLSNLDEFAEYTGGTYRYSRRVSDIPNELKTLVKLITNPYIIDIKVRGLKADGLSHNLEIGIASNDYTGKGSKTYTAVIIPVPKWVKWAVGGAVLLVIIILVVIFLIRRHINRKRMGITKQRCPECRQRMKDSWDSCPFCKYLPQLKKKKRKKKEKA